MSKHHPRCALCGRRMRDHNAIVNPREFPYLLVDVDGLTHHKCAATDSEEALRAQASDRADYKAAINGRLE